MYFSALKRKLRKVFKLLCFGSHGASGYLRLVFRSFNPTIGIRSLKQQIFWLSNYCNLCVIFLNSGTCMPNACNSLCVSMRLSQLPHVLSLFSSRCTLRQKLELFDSCAACAQFYGCSPFVSLLELPLRLFSKCFW